MNGMLHGQYRHNIDAKGRLFVPAKLREKLGDTFMAAAVLDQCICLYTKDEWERLLESLAALPMAKTRHLQRYLSANASDVEVDAQGRILLPKHLLQYASLAKEALVVGAGKRAEIWNPDRYDQTMAVMTTQEVENNNPATA